MPDRFRLRTCRGCGCNDLRACPGGCTWVLLDIGAPSGVCSACAEEVAWHPGVLLLMGQEEPDHAELADFAPPTRLVLP